MHPAINYRQSRRSACDRCRGFKLRCERDQVTGRSCERCLKAQVVCTTNIGQPAPSLLASEDGAYPLTRDCNGLLLSSERVSMSALHKTSSSKVRKPPVPSETSRRHESQRPGCWKGPDAFPYLAAGGFPSLEDDAFLRLPSHSSSTLSFEPWADQYCAWPSGTYHLPSVEDNIIGSGYDFRHEQSSTESLLVAPSTSTQNELAIDNVPFVQPSSLNLLDLEPISIENGDWNSSWESKDASSADKDQPMTSFVDRPANPLSLQRELLRLNLDLIDDLGLLEASSVALRSSSLLREDITPAVGKLDVPIFRMLNHAEQFLEIIQTGTGSPSKRTNLASDFGSISKDLSMYDDAAPFAPRTTESNAEDGSTSTSSHDSGYLTMIPSPSGLPKGLETPKCDLSTSLSMLAAYCHLVRIYRAVFSQLYQLFLIIPPVEAAAFLLLPSLQFGQFHMDGNLTVQAQVLIELSSSMLAKIERHLGLSYGSSMDTAEDSSPATCILENSPLASIGDHILTQEQMAWGIPLKETMQCLRQLLKDNVGL
ncbi:uncharacterized protein N7459_005626 [Penicillium hispanicum]|uniref:uncharacterized protein n=1 Tax=Penicillium hispanicum TaxID=1080232 RepID=UPI002541E395|nr:uncharacterized protein N7459_005626 [Penicillium hispanicum]KAJ5579641.1 hypothetical protein N7459_005626 [Penicillium hispanicum]